MRPCVGPELPCDIAGYTGAAVNRFLYAAHRWISAAALAQLVIWISSGLFFASFSIERVRGEHVEMDRSLVVDDATGLIAPGTAVAVARAAGVTLEALELRRTPEGPVWIARGPHHAAVRLDARSAAVLPVTRVEAEAVARADQRDAPAIVDAILVERDAPIEYRDRPLPAWRVKLADERGTVVWVDGRTAEITARRNDLWRWYDFLWSLHIMDYGGRETFHHPLLIVAAALAALAVASGSVVWMARIARRFRKPRKAR